MSILTIAIPTYNRAIFLQKCLLSLKKNNIDATQVEIVIIDNHSDDKTEDVVKELQKDMVIKYIRNDRNIGPDENFKKCLRVASSKYVWIFGDDDLFKLNAIGNIIRVIKESMDIGLIHLRAENFTNKMDDNQPEEIINYKIFKSNIAFMKQVHTNITFLSANIVNKENIFDNINLDEIPNNNLGQVYWSLVATIKAEKNIFISSKLIGARKYNSRNYNFCEVFGNNFIEILYIIDEKFQIKNLIRVFKRRLLIMYFPANIARLRVGVSKVKYKNCFNIFYKHFHKDIYFWIFTFPALVLPKQIIFKLYKIAEKMRGF